MDKSPRRDWRLLQKHDERGWEPLVILTDVFPASEGMPLEGELDETVSARLDAAPDRGPASSSVPVAPR